MKNGRLSLRLSDKRINKLKAYASQKDKTLTHLIEEWIDELQVVMETSVPPVSR